MPKSPPRNLNSPYADFFIKWMARGNTWLYKLTGGRIFDTSRDVDPLSASGQGSRDTLEPLLHDAGLPADVLDALGVSRPARADAKAPQNH